MLTLYQKIKVMFKQKKRSVRKLVTIIITTSTITRGCWRVIRAWSTIAWRRWTISASRWSPITTRRWWVIPTTIMRRGWRVITSWIRIIPTSRRWRSIMSSTNGEQYILLVCKYKLTLHKDHNHMNLL